MAEQNVIISCADAKAQLLKRYFTGKPCKRGHIEERSIYNCECIRCAREKDRRWKDANREKMNTRMRRSRAVDGPQIDDRLRKKAERRAANKEQESAYYKRRYSEHKERICEDAKRAYRNDPQKNIVRAEKWRRENPEKAREKSRLWFKKWRSDPNNREKEREYHRRYYREKPNKTAAGHKRRALKKNSNGTHTAADLVSILKAQKFRCVYCRADLLKEKKSLDHIVALSRGGSNDKTNLQYTCVPCNGKKHAKDPIAFAREIGLLL